MATKLQNKRIVVPDVDGPTEGYSLPTTGILSYVPVSWVPYGELMRIDKPTGIYAFYFHHLFGTLYGSILTPTAVPDLLRINGILFGGTIFMRGAACSWNDTLDREYDRQVKRCRLRPIARGALSPLHGHMFTCFLTLIALSFLYQLPANCAILAMPKIILLMLYPFAKRFTDFPQLVLGFEMASGIFIGAAAVGYDIQNAPKGTWIALLLFYLAQVCWTVVYDTVYAQQDVEDDAKAGVRSMAVRFKDGPRELLTFVALSQVVLLASSGWIQGFGVAYFSVACGGTAALLFWNVYTIDLKNPSECMWWFMYGSRFVGIMTSVGLALEATSR
ncbi:UbiA prenyltransferase family-domain-containing protein [Massariosphaeria phaeospora]|uniref:4-hydroxybenzoate polyprenyltransferase, mitochondrial n=1 Tax=Massariosphaeria phaeospora TaxID=100035 RepID=A0A7C8MD70_9PLEO|nr:UbiA prenyltransferase family-domain-containing protein [Massariosphaeria phaeospora]